MGFWAIFKSVLLLLPLFRCTVNSHQRDRRMIAGRRASIEDWKFAASLVFLQPLRRWEICTATLVDRFWLVTAAHCVDDLTRSPEYLKVKMYSKTRAYGVTASSIYSVEKIITHPMRYIMKVLSKIQGYSWDFDIALLRLNESVANGVVPVKIAEEDAVVDGCKSAGWGSTEMLQNLSDAKTKNYQLSKFLQEIDVPLVPWEACYDFRHSDHKSFAAVNYHVLCGGATGSSSKNKQRGCIGDSGSPLVCNSRGGKRLHGILLGGDPFCNHGSSYMIFTHIAKHRAWINRTTQLPSYQETQTGHRYPNVAKHQ